MSSPFRTVVETLRRPMSVYAEDGEATRHATWLELFFDLVFIVAVAELGALLREGVSLGAVFEYASLFVLVWWAWVGFSYYADVFDADDLFSQLALIVVMFGVIVMSQTVPEALHGGSFAFAAAFLVLRALYIGLTLRAWYTASAFDKFYSYWVTFSSLSTVVWAFSLLYPEPGRFGLWISAFMLEIAGIGIVYLVFDTVPVQVSHFPERLGLFTILVLGETILAVAVGTEGTDWLVSSGLTALGGFLIAVALWWIYFENFDERTIDRALEGDEVHWLHMRERMLVYVFGHYFVFTGIGAAGVGLEAAIEAAVAGHGIEPSARGVLAGGIAAFLLGSSVCHRAMPAPLHQHLFLVRIAVATVVALGALLGGAVPPYLVTWLLAALLIGVIVFEGTYGRRAPPLAPTPQDSEMEP